MEAKEESSMLIIKVEVAIAGRLPERRRERNEESESDAKPSSSTQQQYVGEEDMLDDEEEGQATVSADVSNNVKEEKKNRHECFKCLSLFVSYAGLMKHLPTCVFCPKCLRFRDYRHPDKCHGPPEYIQRRVYCVRCRTPITRIGRHMAKVHGHKGRWRLKDHPREAITMEQHQSREEERLLGLSVVEMLAVADPSKVALHDLLEVNRHLHAKALSKAAILEYTATAAKRITPELISLSNRVASFRRSPQFLKSEGAVGDLFKLRALISELDTASRGIDDAKATDS